MYETDVQNNPEPTRPSRPRQITVLAVLLTVFGLLGILAAALLMSIISDSADTGRSVPAVLYLLGYAQFALSATLALCGVFVWQGRSWARVLAIALCSVNLVGALVTLISGAVFQAIAGFAINVALIRLLTGSEVQAWCDR